jgi:alpha,alpha-trehalose phosphorylase
MALAALRFRFRYRGRCLLVEIGRPDATYRLLEGDELRLFHEDEELVVTREPVSRPWMVPTVGPEPRQPPGRAPARRRPRG